MFFPHKMYIVLCYHFAYFQEFSKEVEGKSNLKSAVVTEGNQLLRLKKVDTVVLRSDLARIDTQWTELLTRIPVVQEKLHQVPSHAMEWLSYFTANWITLSAALLICRGFYSLSVCFSLNVIYTVSKWMRICRSKWKSWPPAMLFLNCLTGYH